MLKSSSLIAVLLLTLCAGCSRQTGNVVESADQAAIDAYEAQKAENDKALKEYKEIK